MEASTTMVDHKEPPGVAGDRHYTWDGRVALCGVSLRGDAYSASGVTIDCENCLAIQAAREAEFTA